MAITPRLRAWTTVVATLLITAAWLAWIHRQSQPVLVPDAQVTSVPCVSYAPFRRSGHTPFDARLVITTAQVKEDLRILAALTRCVRTYGVDQGLEAVPAVAQRLGMRVVLGAWIGRDPTANTKQIDAALNLAAAHRDTVVMVVIGNEVLLRRELDATALAALLADAKRRSPVPVAYADVWEFWLRHGAALRDHVDVVAVHVLPYWEDDPVHVNDAVVHVRTVLDRVRRAFADRRVWLAETGWPAAGRQRGPAVPGRVEQAVFVRGVLDALPRNERDGVDVNVGMSVGMNIVEGFDQPWKRALEGAAGGYWGLFDAEGQARAALRGGVVPRPDAQRALALAGFGAVVGGLAAALWQRRRIGTRLLGLIFGIAAGAGLTAAAAWQWQVLVESSLDGRAWVVGSVVMAVAMACALLACARVIAALGGDVRSQRTLGAWQAVPHDERLPGAVREPHAWRTRIEQWIHLAWLGVTATLALQLVFDARYRDVSWPMLAATAACVLLLRWCAARLDAGAREERALGVVLALCAIVIAMQEGAANAQAWSAVFACAGAAASTCILHRATSVGSSVGTTVRRPAATHASSASTAAGADHPAP